jgi:uncharacterized protein YjaZ
MWSLHFLNAGGKLAPHIELITQTLNAAKLHLAAMTPLFALDIVISSVDIPGATDIGILGYSGSPRLIHLTFDYSLFEDASALMLELQKTIYHEFHHALRWEGPGYGFSLGEALVTEGLAQHFVHQAMDCAAEPWEAVLTRAALAPFADMANAQFDVSDYSHADWFFNAQPMPRWLGYSLGYAIVGDYLLDQLGASALSLASAPAEIFRAYCAGLCKA